MVTPIQQVTLNQAYQLQEVEFALQKVGEILHTQFFATMTMLHHIKRNRPLLSAQVGCKAIVCPVQFKTQRYCDMLRQICPEIESSSPGSIRSARCVCVSWRTEKCLGLYHRSSYIFFFLSDFFLKHCLTSRFELSLMDSWTSYFTVTPANF